MSGAKIAQGNVLDLWAKNFETVTTWLSHLQEKELNAYSLYRFCVWAKMTPDELLAEKTKNPSANKVEKLLDKFILEPGFKNSFKYQVSIAVKSYFRWSYCDLAKASGSVVLEKVKDYNKLSKEGLRKLWNRGRSPRDRALIPFVTSTAIAKETLSKLTWGHLEENWETIDLPAINIESALLKGHGIGRYKGVRQVTFLMPEAKRELLNYKEWIEQKLGRKLGPEDHIWLDIRTPFDSLEYDAISTVIQRLSRDSGIPFTLHDGRRWLNTAVEQIGLSPNWARVLRGRKVSGSENPYSRPNIEALRAKFREAVPLLEFTSERQAIPKDVQERLTKMEEEYRALKGQYGYFRKTRHANPPEDEPKNKEDNCEDGKHCQKMVTEEELAMFLCTGWKVVATLPSGKIVIDR